MHCDGRGERERWATAVMTGGSLYGDGRRRLDYLHYGDLVLAIEIMRGKKKEERGDESIMKCGYTFIADSLSIKMIIDRFSPQKVRYSSNKISSSLGPKK